MTVSILFVCLGNICRSPSAEAVFRHFNTRTDVTSDSAGTGGWHAGYPADGRAQKEARRRGYDMSDLRARPVTLEDFISFDMILGMDDQNMRDLEALKPANSTAEIILFRNFTDDPGPVPDPYYDGSFTRMFDLIEDGVHALNTHLTQTAR